MDRFQYLALMGGCVLITLPLEFVLGARVYRRPRRLFSTLAVVFVVFFAWDALAIARHAWSFSAAYITGWHAPFRVPMEEAVFFIVIPICALLTYEAVGRLLRSTRG